MKTVSFRATIIAETEDFNIREILTALNNGEYDLSLTDDFMNEPTIFLEKKTAQPEKTEEQV